MAVTTPHPRPRLRAEGAASGVLTLARLAAVHDAPRRQR
jgi:hypothetical protein